jgi:hypothetical protein
MEQRNPQRNPEGYREVWYRITPKGGDKAERVEGF